MYISRIFSFLRVNHRIRAISVVLSHTCCSAPSKSSVTPSARQSNGRGRVPWWIEKNYGRYITNDRYNCLVSCSVTNRRSVAGAFSFSAAALINMLRLSVSVPWPWGCVVRPQSRETGLPPWWRLHPRRRRLKAVRDQTRAHLRRTSQGHDARYGCHKLWAVDPPAGGARVAI
jgi:hypothetical protein